MEVSSLWFNTQFTIARAPHVLRLKSLEGKILKPTSQVDFENEFYHVKTVNHPEELAQVLSLRFEVFFNCNFFIVCVIAMNRVYNFVG